MSDSANQAILEAFNAGKYCDLKIVCQEQTFNVHKAVVCVASKYLEAVGEVATGSPPLVNLYYEDSEMIRRMIVYMYVGDYDPTMGYETAPLHAIPLACKLDPDLGYKPNNLHDIEIETMGKVRQSLKLDFETASDVRCGCFVPTEGFNPCLSHQCPDALSTHAEMFILGERFGVKGLCEKAVQKFEACLRYLRHVESEDFVEAVRVAYGHFSKRPELRNAIAAVFKKHFSFDLSAHPQMVATLPEFNELSLLLLRDRIHQLKKLKHRGQN